MKIGLVGETYQEDSLPFNAQRSINLYAVLDQTGKEVGAMYGTPGLYLFGNLGTGPWREEFKSGTGRCFGISGSQLYEINADGTGTLRGSINQSSGTVFMCENPNQLAICDLQSLYIFTYATNTFKQIIGGLEYCTNGNFTSSAGWTPGAGWSIAAGIATAAGGISTALTRTAAFTLVAGTTYTTTYTVLTASAGSVTLSIGGTAGTARTTPGIYTETIIAGATQVIALTGAGFTGTIDNVSINDPAFGLPSSIGSVSFLDGYFIVNQNGTRRFYISSSNNGTAWNALDFASKESSSDPLMRPVPAVGQLWNLGAITGEVWTNTGASAFPFQRIAGAKLTVGIYAPASAVEADNSLFWLGATKEGWGIIYRASGFVPTRISTTPIEEIIKKATDPTNIRGFSYQQDGHLFYMLTGGGLPTSLIYDITTKMWHERAYSNAQGNFEPHLAACFMSAFGKIICGDRRNGNLYVLDIATYSDNGDAMVSERIYTHVSDEDQRIRYNRLVIGVENGVGLQSGQGSIPILELSISKDGGRTWSDWQPASIGEVGEFQTKVAFRRLGTAEIMTFRIRISDPVKRRLVGSYLK